MSVLESVKRDLAKWPADVAGSALAATALVLAAELDSDSSATSKSMCANSLINVWNELRALAPEVREGDDLDDLAARRAARLGVAEAAHSARS